MISVRMNICEAQAEREESLKSLVDCLNELQKASQGDLEKFAATSCRILRPWTSPSKMLKEIAHWLGEAREMRTASSDTSVRIMTMHSAKGLESDIVIIVGLEEGVFPRDNETAVDEKARQLFVSMTRPKSELHLFHAAKRDASKSYLKQSFALQPSRFLNSIPKEHVTRRYIPPASSKSRSAKTPSSSK